MEKSEYYIETVEEKVETVRRCFCDRCRNLIWSRYGDTYAKRFVSLFAEYTDEIEYYDVTTGHHDWGNDSCDSIEHKVYCRECIPFIFGEYLERSKGDTSEYIEIEHLHFWSLPKDFCVDTENKGV